MGAKETAIATKQTFHVFCRVGKGQHRIVRMALDHEDARTQAEADGHDVLKVRHAPTTPVDNLSRR